MLLWFVGAASVAVWFVFRDDRFDHRLLAVGVLAPDLIGLVAGTAAVSHSLLACVVVLTAVMVATRGRRPSRRRLLALPIGAFLHLVADGAFTDTAMFWWPLAGGNAEIGPIPTLERGWWNLFLEVLGVAMLAFLWRRHGLSSPERRRVLMTEGRLVDPGSGQVGTC